MLAVFMPLFLPASFSSVATVENFWPLLIIFAVAKLLGEVAEQLKQPAVIGELSAGILLGPAVLDWIRPGQTISFLAELGMLFLMFQAGLQFRGFEWRRFGFTSFGVAVCGVVVPYVAGCYLTRIFGYNDVAASFIGAAMVTTGAGITARVLAVQGSLNDTSSKIIMTAAMVNNVLALVVICLVGGYARGEERFVELLRSCCMPIAFTIVVALCARSIMLRMSPHFEEQKSGTGQFTLIALVIFSLCLVATQIEVAAIIGAFLAGIAMAGAVQQRVQHMVHGVTELLVPFFLAGIGLHLNGIVFTDPRLWVFFTAVTVVACCTKFMSALPVLDIGRTEATQVGLGMMAGGEVGMVAAQVGVGLDVISPEIYGALVFMAVGSTLVTPPLLRGAFRRKAHLGRLLPELS